MKQEKLLALVLLLVATTTWPTEQSRSAARNRATIRISTGETTAVVEPVYDINGHLVDVQGVVFNFAKWVAQRYNFDIDVVKMYRGQGGQDFVGRNVNGTWNGVVGDLLRGDADWGVVYAGYNRPHNAFVDPTFLLSDETVSLFIPYPTVGTNVWSFLQPFSKTTWILLLVSFVVVTVITWLLQKNCSTMGKTPSFGTTVLYFTSVITSQGGTWNHKGKSFIFISAAWCLSCIVLVNAYNGLLTSYLTVVTPKLLVSSIEDLAAKPDVKFYTFNDSYISNYYMFYTVAGPQKILGDVIREHPERILKSPIACLEQVQKGPHACLASTFLGDIIVKMKSKESGGDCTILRVQPPIVSFLGASLIPKRSPLAKTINEGIIGILSAGLQQKALSDYRGGGNRCSANPGTQANDNKKRALGLVNLSGAFILLGIGYQLSLLVFFLERLTFRKRFGKTAH